MRARSYRVIWFSFAWTLCVLNSVAPGAVIQTMPMRPRLMTIRSRDKRIAIVPA